MGGLALIGCDARLAVQEPMESVDGGQAAELADAGTLADAETPADAEASLIACVPEDCGAQPASDESCPDGRPLSYRCAEVAAGGCIWLLQQCPADLCQLPSMRGVGKAHMPRWFFNRESLQCEVFIYGGLDDGNANHFETLEDCQGRCGMGGSKRCGAGQRPCGSGLFCDFFESACGAPDLIGSSTLGTCQPRSSEACRSSPPVCGCDGMPYQSQCDAWEAGTDSTNGPCYAAP
jgi:hypothetical protein